MERLRTVCLMMVGCLAATGWAGDVNEPSNEIDEINVQGVIDESQCRVQLSFEAETHESMQGMILVAGEAVLCGQATVGPSGQLSVDPNQGAYLISWPRAGRHQVTADFAVRAVPDASGLWHQACLALPPARLHSITLHCTHPDLDVRLPGALQVTQRVEEGQRVIQAILGSNQPLQIQWKPQMLAADAKLVFSSRANTLVDVRAGMLGLDTVLEVEIAQGKMESLVLQVPTELQILSLEGAAVRHWRLTNPAEGIRELQVEFSRAQERSLRLQLLAELATGPLPLEIQVPRIQALGGIRCDGTLAVGTHSAMQLVVKQATGLSQIDGAAFPRVTGIAGKERTMPQDKVFCYRYAGGHYDCRLAVTEIVPSYDVAERWVVSIKEDDLLATADLELEVRDAPLRHLIVRVPGRWTVSEVQGEVVDDFQVEDFTMDRAGKQVRIFFRDPFLGRTLIRLQLELGQGPLDQSQPLVAPKVEGAKTQRGTLVIAAQTGIEIETPEVTALRPVHTASVPQRVAQAQFAYRFRQADWQVTLKATRQRAGIRAEVFHLQSVGESLAYGSAVVNYLITGSPVDELRFVLPEDLENVEFVGRDVRRWQQDGDQWVVYLTRKVMGDYTLAVTYTQSYAPEQPIRLGALQCGDVQTQTGTVVVTSHLDLHLEIQGNDSPSALQSLNLDELPNDYRLLTSGPILAAYQYVTEPHEAALSIRPYDRAELLKVVVELASHRTEVSVRPDGMVESITTVRYKVKNAAGQFLALDLPDDCQIWSVSCIEMQEGGSESAHRLVASRDPQQGTLLVPLSRTSNPNDPATIELIYGQVHEARGTWSRALNWSAPRCAVPVTYADWTMTVPEGWTFIPTGGTMQVQQQVRPDLGMSHLLAQLGTGWARAWQGWSRRPIAWVACGVLAALGLGLVWRRRRWGLMFLLVSFLGLSFWVGIEAWQYHTGASVPLSSGEPTLSYAQAVHLDPHQSLQVETRLLPAWRQGMAVTSLVTVGVVLLVATGLFLWKRSLWMVTGPVVVVTLCYGAALFPTGQRILCGGLTWGLPVLVLLGGIGYRLRDGLRRHAGVLVCSVLCLAWGGCATGLDRTLGTVIQVEDYRAHLTAQEDSLALDLDWTVSAEQAGCVTLLAQEAVLLSTPEPLAQVHWDQVGHETQLVLDKPGRYQGHSTFLLPLPEEDAEHRRRLSLALPVALTHAVTLAIPDPNVWIEAPEAVSVASRCEGDMTELTAMFTPGRQAVLTWQPRERQVAEEDIRFHARDLAWARLLPGLVQVTHRVDLQIAQGQLGRLTLTLPAEWAVTSVETEDLGGWHFDPTSATLQVHWLRPISGSACLKIEMQQAQTQLPYALSLEPIVVQEALSQQSLLGLMSDPAVYPRVDEGAVSLPGEDFLRQWPALASQGVTSAYRFDRQQPAVTGRVLAVQSELRACETARFNVEEERLVYNSQWSIEIRKAGRFEVDLRLPPGFEIDSLVSNEISHWDEPQDQSLVRVHFKRKIMGTVIFNLALSQPMTQISPRLTVPRVQLVGALKHTGQLQLAAEQGVRLNVTQRQGVSELNPSDWQGLESGMLAFRLLRPDWRLDLQTEILPTRITAQCLQIAEISEGLIRHRHAVRYQLLHAGTKRFTVGLPPDATAVILSGPRVARREQIEPGLWQIELEDKIFEQPYLLRISYETRYDPALGQVTLEPVVCHDTELQEGYVAVFAKDRMELAVNDAETTLRPAEARHLSPVFGAGDLSGAVMCYRRLGPDQALHLQARRHAAVDQIEAKVQQTALTTLVTPSGQMLTRLQLTLRVGSRRHLQVTLPLGATVWSLQVDGQAAQPSRSEGTQAEGPGLLIPLPQQAGDEVLVELVYIDAMALSGHWAGKHRLEGPRFDVPLQGIGWSIYVPDGFDYNHFEGTLTHTRNQHHNRAVRHYDLKTYEQQVEQNSRLHDRLAQQQQDLAREFSQQGQQVAARRALSKGYHYSMSNLSLNEDIRVDLDNLLRQQAKSGLVNARGRFRQYVNAGPEDEVSPMQPSLQSLESRLAQADNENLELITRCIIQTQQAALGSVAQLQINLPTHGRLLRFESPLQVEPATPMAVVFQAHSTAWMQKGQDVWVSLGCTLVLICVATLLRQVTLIVERREQHKVVTPEE